MQYLFALISFLAAPALASPIVKRANNQLIQSTTSGLCLSPTSGAAGVANGALGDDTNVVVLDCNDAPTWDISPGSGSIILTGTNYALDAGENPGAIGGVKIYQSYPGLEQQTWYLTDDHHIAISGGTQCLTQNPSGPNYTQCGGKDQEWRVFEKGSTPHSSCQASD